MNYKPNSKWYWSKKSGDQKGPVNWVNLKKMVRKGKIKPEDNVWTKGMEGWKNAKNVEGLSLEKDNYREGETYSSKGGGRNEIWKYYPKKFRNKAIISSIIAFLAISLALLSDNLLHDQRFLCKPDIKSMENSIDEKDEYIEEYCKVYSKKGIGNTRGERYKIKYDSKGNHKKEISFAVLPMAGGKRIKTASIRHKFLNGRENLEKVEKRSKKEIKKMGYEKVSEEVIKRGGGYRKVIKYEKMLDTFGNRVKKSDGIEVIVHAKVIKATIMNDKGKIQNTLLVGISTLD